MSNRESKAPPHDPRVPKADAAHWAEKMATLRDIGTAVATGMERDELLNLVCRYLRQFVNFESFAAVFRGTPQEGLECALLMKGTECLVDSSTVMGDWRPLLQMIVETEKPVLINNWQRDGRSQLGDAWRRNEAIHGSWLGVPMISGSGPVGVIAIDHPQPEAFDPRDQLLLEATVGILVIAIQKAELQREHLRRSEQLTTLGQIGEMIVSELDLDKTLTTIMEHVNRVFNVEAGSLLLVEGDQLTFKVAVGAKSDLVKPFSLKIGQGIAGWVAQTGKPQLVSEAKTDKRHFDQIDQKTDFETRSILCVPMEHKGRVIGVLEIINPLDGRLFNDDDLQALQKIATSAVVAIENALLHKQTERRLAEVSMLYTLAKQVTSSLELNTVLQSVVNVLKESFACRASCIFLLNDRTDLLEIRAASGVAPHWVKNAKMKIGEGVSGKVVQSGVPIYVRDTRQYKDYVIFDEAVLSLLVVPLVIKGQVVGTLSVDDSKANVFAEGDERLLTIAAAQAAVAIENARLYEGLKERARRLQRAYEELKEVNRLKTELVQNVSHELRTPMTFIKGYAELLFDGSLGELNAMQLDALRIISERTEAVVRLVGDMITLQRTEIGHFSFAPARLAEVVSQALEGARVSASRAGVTLTSDVPENLPLVMADRGRIVQVFDNLLGNAIKFSPDGGEVTVRAQVEPEGDRVLVTVEDHGVGIPEDKLEKIFERFFQVDGSMTRRFGGTGLGLAIVRQIVQAHRGKVWAMSDLGKGSTFCFTLPIVSENPKAAQGL